MHKRPLAIAGGLLLLFGLAATPAFADCAEKLKELDTRFLSVPELAPAHEKIRSLLQEAKEALDKGQKKKCEAKAKIAEGLLDNVSR